KGKGLVGWAIRAFFLYVTRGGGEANVCGSFDFVSTCLRGSVIGNGMKGKGKGKGMVMGMGNDFPRRQEVW
ncbi:hypothetical protein F4809DRAFT_613844, partial [Biscogniauxia mediterranea]